MELELRVYQLEYEQRWNWLQLCRQQNHVLADFVSFRDDGTYVSLHESDAPSVDAPIVVDRKVRRLATAVGSTITAPEELARLHESPVLEIRFYRVVQGQRRRFCEFFRDRALEPLTRCGMAVYGMFEDRDDPNTVVWFRGFPSLVERDRRKALFYESALWLDDLQHEALPLIEDFTNVMLVTPAGRA